ncbi:MAG TPA: serine/threonine-protein kinase [Myxococcus sp.]|nr:serine/threonine-protein kinase [Myxococcus sp.]
MQPGPLNPASLPSGAQVGPWRIVDRLGDGAFGTVFLAAGPVPGASSQVALKVAHTPRSARFGREAELLSRIHHPAVPRLIGHGQWMSPTGMPHPWLAMELLKGIPLYEWAGAFRPSSRQVLRVLARLARALEATHAVGGIHRDVKGDNVLVRPSDGQAFLVDFGSGTYPDAPPLTGPVFPPGTPHYRSPEAYRFALRILEQPVKIYAPKPAEDLFALGVTAYKLVTGEYPPTPEPLDVRFHVWRTEGPGPQPAHELNRRCSPELSAFISRMLSRQPEARGTARELAEAMERAVREAGPQADAPLFRREAHGPVEVDAAPRPEDLPPPPPPTPAPGWHPWLLAASVTGLLVLSGIWKLASSLPEQAAQEDRPDAGTVAVGDSVPTASVESSQVPSAKTPIGLELPSRPFPGQTLPDARGQCPRGTQVAINGGCWIKVDMNGRSCPKEAFVYRGACYEPASPFPQQRPNTSGPSEGRDGG